jgi:ERCC4-type nuclease
MRLIDCGLPTCLYIVEAGSTSSHNQNFAPTAMSSAIVSTAIESGLHVLRTRGLDHTASTLRANHLKVAARFKSGRCGTKFLPLAVFQKQTVKKHVETVGDLFSHALRQIPLCGSAGAQALVNRFGTMARLMKYVEETDPRVAQKEISLLQKVGVSQRIGPKLAQNIWSLFAEQF